MPDPILISIAAALVGKAAGALASGGRTALGRLFGLTKKKAAAAALLEAPAQGVSDEQRAEQLAVVLEQEGVQDPAFAASLRELWAQARIEMHAEGDAVINDVSGTVSGNVVQARDIQGGISFGSPNP